MKKRHRKKLMTELKKFEQTLEYEFNEKLAEKRKEIDEEIKREKSVELLKLDREKLFKRKKLWINFSPCFLKKLKKTRKSILHLCSAL